SGDNVLIFIDRGILDDMSYVGKEAFAEIMKEFGMKPEELNDRYDMVVHLVTSAKGKEEAYTYSNNSARYETIEQARAMDDAALEAWKDHPNRKIIGNEDIFEVKMLKAIQSVFEYLGANGPVEKYSKYLIEVNDDVLEKFAQEANYNCSHIIQHYLTSDNGYERRIRARYKGDDILYSYSEANYLSTNERIKVDRVLTERQYKDYKHQIDESIAVTDKMRYSFIKDGLFYKLDVFDFDTTKGLISITDTAEGKKAALPDYVTVIKDVTGDVNYKNYFLAKSQKY
ncbi:MAG: AAA family ATPase, partial [Erysipelotrichaceae bacterium]|nr:AAA family ATPase [Erysipelotrichaceae bacterium]